MQAKFSLFTVAALPIIPIALACGGGDSGGKITVRPDAAKAIDAAPVVCTAAPSYAGVVSGSNTQFAGSNGVPMATGSNAYSIYWAGRMDPTAMPDFIEVDLYEGVGPFSSGITPQTISLTGDEAAYATCGACVLMFTDLHSAGSSVEITDYYMPTAGSLMLQDVTGTFMGTITGLQMQHMLVSGNMLVPANDGCVASIPTMTMNAMIKPQTAGSAAGKPEPGGKMSFQFKLPHRLF